MRNEYPVLLRRVRVRDPDSGESIVLSTHHVALPAATISALYRYRWQIEIFFKWIKQHLRIKAFLGTSANAMKTQVWIAIAVYVLTAIVRKRLQLAISLYELLQVLSVTLFEQTPSDCALRRQELQPSADDDADQLNLFPD